MTRVREAIRYGGWGVMQPEDDQISGRNLRMFAYKQMFLPQLDSVIENGISFLRDICLMPSQSRGPQNFPPIFPNVLQQTT